jgi:hypothetical protein
MVWLLIKNRDDFKLYVCLVFYLYVHEINEVYFYSLNFYFAYSLLNEILGKATRVFIEGGEN